ncbi:MULTISPECIES: ThuA domain-containing protein [Paenibacillus]|uniref:ThuA domain-containing protein n=1 Tax=Paenibacillus lignilyticus TaxID=1172615 RepID=A0ABS5CJ68_9BACL|nr:MULTISPECIES: ThuA domain-containing protein [Paenibacillus]MBP3965915.1 ThuA domain-containing protein [Paenibacillus lignilyticus]
MRKALIVWGGWDGHQPEEVAGIFADLLNKEGFEVTVSDTLDAYKDEELMAQLDLIVPVWTMGSITQEQLRPLLDTVRAGCGIAGCHGGMGDSFRNDVDYQFMVGGQWVAHPGNDGVVYDVNMVREDNPLTSGIGDFEVCTEKYYMHVDPANEVHATTSFGDVKMPIVWTKTWGEGRVYYNSLGHQANIVAMPQTLELMRRGFLWAARGSQEA